MKRLIYRNLYNLLSALSQIVNSRHINRCKIAVGTSLLLLSSGCQASKKTNKSEDDKDTVYTDTVATQAAIDGNILCYELTVIEDSTETVVPPPPPPEVRVEEEELIMCYYHIEETIEDTIPTDPNEVYQIVEQMPEFPGGNNAMMEFIRKNVYYPNEYSEMCIQGRVIVRFIVEKDGSISNPEIIRGIDPKLDEIALEVVGKFPKFKPGTQRGEPVRVEYNIPVSWKY